MPGQDRTGPLGQGPMTGRGLGPCGAGTGVGLARGRGIGRGFGRGFGFRRGFAVAQPLAQPVMQPQVITEAEEKQMLQDELKAMQAEKAEIEKRLKELKK